MKRIILFFITAIYVLPMTGQVTESWNMKINYPERTINNTDREQFSVYCPKDTFDHGKNKFLKSEAANNQKLDSTIYDIYDDAKSDWIHSSKNEFDYDENGNNILLSGYQWIDSLGLWTKHSKNELMYNTKDEIVQQIYYKSDSSDSWVFNYKYDYAYDENGYKLSQINSNWDKSSGNWVFFSRGIIANDIHGYPMADTISLWNVNNQVWDAYSLLEYGYDSAGNELQYIVSLWNTDSSKWNFKNKIDYAYDVAGYKVLEIDYDWDPISYSWLNRIKYEFAPDTAGNDTTEITYHWNESNKIWQPYIKFQDTYGENGLLTHVNYRWDNVSLIWGISDSTKNLYDLNGEIVSISHYYLNKSDGTFHNLSLTEYSYDMYGNQTEQTFYNWDESGMDWAPKNRYSNYYSAVAPIQTSVRGPAVLDISLYPNPVEGYISFRLPGLTEPAKLELFDLQGKRVLERYVTSSDPVWVGNLNSGFYVYRLVYNGKSQSGKIILQ